MQLQAQPHFRPLHHLLARFRSGFKWLSFLDSRRKFKISRPKVFQSSESRYQFTNLPIHFIYYFYDLAARKFDKYIPAQDYFQKALYMFDIGQNDLAGAFYSKTLDQILASIPTILSEFEGGIEVSKLYVEHLILSPLQPANDS